MTQGFPAIGIMYAILSFLLRHEANNSIGTESMDVKNSVGGDQGATNILDH